MYILQTIFFGGLKPCSNSYLHLNISRSALCNISLAGFFPAYLITNCT